MSIPLPAGHRLICMSCDGRGSRLRPRAAAIRTLVVSTAVVEEECRPCEGTGWIPPKHAEPQTGGEDQE